MENKYNIDEIIEHMSAILDEATEYEDSVCYVTDADADILNANIEILKSLKAKKSKYVLSGTDGFSIDSTVYDTFVDAQNAMRAAYSEYSTGIIDEDDGGESYCGQRNAILFGDNTVYCWDITEVSF